MSLERIFIKTNTLRCLWVRNFKKTGKAVTPSDVLKAQAFNELYPRVPNGQYSPDYPESITDEIRKMEG